MIVLDVFWMTLIIQKKSDYGTQHPAFARLAIQISELVEWSSLPKQDRTAIADLYADKLKTRFLRCDEILDRLKARLKQSCNEVGCEDQNPNVRVIPYVAGLDGEAESFAYEVKNFLRDLLAVFQIFFTCHLTDASAWYKSKGFGDSALVTWSARKFGDKDKLTELLRTDQPV